MKFGGLAHSCPYDSRHPQSARKERGSLEALPLESPRFYSSHLCIHTDGTFTDFSEAWAKKPVDRKNQGTSRLSCTLIRRLRGFDPDESDLLPPPISRRARNGWGTLNPVPRLFSRKLFQFC